MDNQFSLDNILFLDIETVPQHRNFDECPEPLKLLWEHKSKFLKLAENESLHDSWQRAGIYSEFGKIICISVAQIFNGDEILSKSFAGDNEQFLLTDFSLFIDALANPWLRLCAHNGKEFDFPYLSRRMIINKVPVPKILDTSGKKPWEIMHLDTLELWKFGDYKNYTPLNLLAYVFGLKNPKEDLDGSKVAGVYYNENGLSRIVKYCENDVVTLLNVFLRMKGFEPITSE